MVLWFAFATVHTPAKLCNLSGVDRMKNIINNVLVCRDDRRRALRPSSAPRFLLPNIRTFEFALLVARSADGRHPPIRLGKRIARPERAGGEIARRDRRPDTVLDGGMVSGSANEQLQPPCALAPFVAWRARDPKPRAAVQARGAGLPALRSGVAAPAGGRLGPEAECRILPPTLALLGIGREDVESVHRPAHDRPWRKHSTADHA
jgi:hypothetical protein